MYITIRHGRMMMSIFEVALSPTFLYSSGVSCRKISGMSLLDRLSMSSSPNGSSLWT